MRKELPPTKTPWCLLHVNKDKSAGSSRWARNSDAASGSAIMRNARRWWPK
jgi:hypothetical protein